ncbi:Hypp5119 [Branchiostoma lanceolatum]|uniref:Hypp5119 protein n=1 Tax=Branchiostoma lanceolatum TaxID=7740 RepID=A0A8K0AD88_BRALA|nr:Hypp5119 [Branchiostoma lanceolatum]
MLPLSALPTDLNRSDESKRKRVRQCVLALTFVLLAVVVILVYRYSIIVSQVLVGVATPLFVGAVLFECCCHARAHHRSGPGEQCATEALNDFEQSSTTLLRYGDPQATLPPYARVEEEPPQYDAIYNGQTMPTATYPGTALQTPPSYPETSQPLESCNQEQTMQYPQDIGSDVTDHSAPPPPYEEAVSPVK